MNRNHCFSYTTIRKMLIAFVVLSMVALNGCGYQKSKDTPALDHRYATKEEGRSLVLENKNYYKEFPIPPSVFEYHITNPDVEHHDSYATFVIDGRNIDCFTDMVTTKHFEKEGDDFFDSMTTALIPIDGTDVYYTPKHAANFDEIFGKNTDYVIDPEECMADNFAYSVVYGMNGKDGNSYPNPEIIEGILSYLQTK